MTVLPCVKIVLCQPKLCNLWSMSSLKAFLAKRYKAVDGNHGTLSAMGYIAWGDGTPVDASTEHKLNWCNLSDYKDKLSLIHCHIHLLFRMVGGMKKPSLALP